ncbi:MAG: inorganic diphosphatase [Chthoniobacterales bacterium]|nr:inorganic diphosphatase [Chthoniobacterales bacterium]
MATHPFSMLPPFDRESGDLHVVIDTPKGSRNKFAWREKRELFELGGVLPAGAVFPYDFGFIPNTRGGDGDALDVLVLMDEPAFSGCLVACRVLGVIEAEQTEKGKTLRNDRLIAVASTSRTHGHLQSLDDLNAKIVDEIEHFFVSYNAAKGKKFKPLGRSGPERARELVLRGTRNSGVGGRKKRPRSNVQRSTSK